MRRDLLKTRSFAALHFGVAFTVAFHFHERAWRRVDGRGPSRNNVPVPCCGVRSA